MAEENPQMLGGIEIDMHCWAISRQIESQTRIGQGEGELSLRHALAYAIQVGKNIQAKRPGIEVDLRALLLDIRALEQKTYDTIRKVT